MGYASMLELSVSLYISVCNIQPIYSVEDNNIWFNVCCFCLEVKCICLNQNLMMINKRGDYKWERLENYFCFTITLSSLTFLTFYIQNNFVAKNQVRSQMGTDDTARHISLFLNEGIRCNGEALRD